MKYQKCKKCKMEIPKKAKVCHHCGANQGMGCGTALVILVFLVLLLSIPFMANGNKGDKSPSDKPATSKSESTSTTPQSSTPPETKYPTINGFIIGDKKGTTDDFDYPRVRRLIARNASSMTELEKKELINALFGEE